MVGNWHMPCRAPPDGSLPGFRKAKIPNSEASGSVIPRDTLHERWLKTDPRLRNGDTMIYCTWHSLCGRDLRKCFDDEFPAPRLELSKRQGQLRRQDFSVQHSGAEQSVIVSVDIPSRRRGMRCPCTAAANLVIGLKIRAAPERTPGVRYG